MSLKDQLRAVGFHNSHGFCFAYGVLNQHYPLDRPKPPKVEGVPSRVPQIYYQGVDRGRDGWGAYWAVSQIGIVLDPNAHWHYKDFYGGTRMSFDVDSRDQKQPQFEAALAWAQERFGIEEWAKDPFGHYLPKAFVAARLKQLKLFIKENS